MTFQERPHSRAAVRKKLKLKNLIWKNNFIFRKHPHLSKKKHIKKNSNPIDSDKITEIPGTISFPHHVGSAVVKPEDKGKIKGRAMMAMRDQTQREMSQLYEQMQVLVRQAEEIKSRVEVSEKIYRSTINFEPVINHFYYLYEKEDGTNILSMISPEEWGKNIPYKKYLAKIKLLSDHTWDVLEKGKE